MEKSLSYLKKAGIKVWMLTGDKLETAKSISISSGLFNPNLDKIYTIQDVHTSVEMNTELKNLLSEVHDSVVRIQNKTYNLRL